MAKGIPFPEANLVLRAPTPEDAAAGTVYDLHVHRYRDLDGNPNCISKWQFDADELAQVIAAGGVFWFHAWGATHPPIHIDARDPFVRAARPVPVGGCTCMEIDGEDPDCSLHGLTTPWALENLTAEEWQEAVVKLHGRATELRRVLETIDRDARPDNWDDEPGSHAEAWRALDKALGK